ncbi:hypothetical protein BH10PSE19_BH10PSE19_00600 [soil metagenome]
MKILIRYFLFMMFCLLVSSNVMAAGEEKPGITIDVVKTRSGQLDDLTAAIVYAPHRYGEYVTIRDGDIKKHPIIFYKEKGLDGSHIEVSYRSSSCMGTPQQWFLNFLVIKDKIDRTPQRLSLDCNHGALTITGTITSEGTDSYSLTIEGKYTNESFRNVHKIAPTI